MIMNEKIYNNTIAFLNRVNLNGQEVDAFNEVKRAITNYYQNDVLGLYDDITPREQHAEESSED